ncbi:hypothetical protein [Corynebacterium timonense]|uniref:Uncharacterized protein n=1 Tax=Corynebacterium timonense TaxID=441500 RepID=A0A1H1RZD9_9CORY|nr:hypothetical protein [Corynebacterium timonense]SDS41131.1 hypothetical protein SAMN04488539_1623 [Corynebacterium timonense]
MSERGGQETFDRSPDVLEPRELLEGVEKLRGNLAGGYRPAWREAEKQGNGVIALGFPTYPRWLWNGIWCGIYLTEFLGIDWQRHRDDFRFISEREAESFDLEQLATWFVVFGNRERMSEGLIGKGAEDGTLYLIARELYDVITSDRRMMSAIVGSDWTAERQRRAERSYREQD